MVKYKKEDALEKMLISADDYQKMGEAGIFDDKPRMELINGYICARSPFTPYHNSHVDKVSQFFNIRLGNSIIVRTQGSIRTDEYSEPEPDITILKFKDNFYNDRQASAEDTLLVIEVAVKSLAKDRTVKLEKYAETGIPEYWIVIPEQSIVEVYRKPENGVYQEKVQYKKVDTWLFETFDLEVKGTDLLI